MEPDERRRLRWIEAYRERPDVGAVCRQFGISRPTFRKWLERFKAEGVLGLPERSRRSQHSPRAKVGADEAALILELRWTRRLGVKRLRHELHRLHGLLLSPATIHKTLVRHELNACHAASGTGTSLGAIAGRCRAIGCRWIAARYGLVSTNLTP